MLDKTIGFIGLGHMGQPMAINLIKQGFHVKVFDLSQEAVRQLAAKGAIPTESAAQAAIDADFVFTMLQTSEQVSKVCLGEKGFLGDKGIFAHLKKNSIYIDCSSIAITTSQALHQEAQDLGIKMLDAPVSGGVKGAENATLTFMVGGDEAIFNDSKPILECMGKSIIYAGGSGNGQAAKICNNMLLGITMIGVSEAFTLAERLGLDPKKFFEISSQASGECWAMTRYCPVPGILPEVPASHGYQPGFMTQMMLKDLKLSQDAARHTSLMTPLGAKATEIYQQFADLDHSQEDFSAIINFIKGEKQS